MAEVSCTGSLLPWLTLVRKNAMSWCVATCYSCPEDGWLAELVYV